MLGIPLGSSPLAQSGRQGPRATGSRVPGRGGAREVVLKTGSPVPFFEALCVLLVQCISIEN